MMEGMINPTRRGGRAAGFTVIFFGKESDGEMIVANDEYIAITRGDCGIIQVTIDMGDDSEYEMAEEDTIELTVREKPTSESPVILHKVGAAGIAQIVLHAEDTQIAPGRYTADIQLNHGDCRYTVWPEIDPTKDYKVKNRKNFIIGAEVTMDE